jgi:hypothetical protein
MSDHSEAYVAFDTSKLRNAVAITEAGRSGEVVAGRLDRLEHGASRMRAARRFVRRLRTLPVVVDRFSPIVWTQVMPGCVGPGASGLSRLPSMFGSPATD